MNAILIVGLVVLCVLVATRSDAQDIGSAATNLIRSTTIDETKLVREATIDLSVPQSPAFTVLGVTPENVIHPATPREFAASLLNGVDPNGNFQTGLALETAPYLLVFGDSITIREYQENRLTQIAARTQFSLATTKGTSDDDKSARLALGLRLTPYDLGDPRNDEQLLKCFTEGELKQVHDRANQLSIEMAEFAATEDPTELEFEREVDDRLLSLEGEAREAAAKCRQETRSRNWNATSWSLGVAPTWTSRDGGTDDLEWSGAALWTSLAYGFEDVPGLEDTSQVTMHARYRSDEQVPDSDNGGGFLEQDTLVLALKARIAGPNIPFGSEPGGRLEPSALGGADLNFAIEVSYLNSDRKNRKSEEYFQYSVGAEYRITDDLYLNLTIGATEGQEKDDQVFALGALNWGFSSEPTINVLPN